MANQIHPTDSFTIALTDANEMATNLAIVIISLYLTRFGAERQIASQQAETPPQVAKQTAGVDGGSGGNP